MWKQESLLHICNKYGTGYAQDPFIDIIDNDVWRIYYSARTKEIVSMPFYIDVEANNPSNILNVMEEPIFYPGAPGTFDDNGITMTSIVNLGSSKLLYYCGWNKKHAVPYQLSIGLVNVSQDNKTYKKFSAGPILDRSINDPIGVSAPFVMLEDDQFRMWYISFTEWKYYNNRIEPTFVIKHATSSNGIDWHTSKEVCIDSTYLGESFARPWVIKDGGFYKMWYSRRGPIGYRDPDGDHYVICCAKSEDGITWTKGMSEPIFSGPPSDWDNEMTAYASVIKGDKYYMLYNGNGFGVTGFGYATCDSLG